MRVWKIEADGATYYAAALTCIEALRVAMQMWEQEGVLEDLVHITVDEQPSGKTFDIVDEDSRVDVHEAASKATEPQILCCSEW